MKQIQNQRQFFVFILLQIVGQLTCELGFISQGWAFESSLDHVENPAKVVTLQDLSPLPPSSELPLPKRKSQVIDLGDIRPQLGIQLFYNPWFLSNQSTNSYFSTNGFNPTVSAAAVAAGANATPPVPAAGTPVTPNPNVGSLGIQVEYQPAFIQKFGVLSIGASFAIDPLFSEPNTQNNYTSSAVSFYSYGALVRYQLKYFHNQPVVPVVGYYFDRFNYNFGNQNSSGRDINGSVMLSGPLFGLWILLNWMEPEVSRSYFVDSGASRSYLTIEAKQIQGQTGTVTSTTTASPMTIVTNWGLYFGIRSEF